MSAPYFIFKPISSHYDYGFGATAESFYDAAKKLNKARKTFFHRQLPVNFLFRHSIELFLKSMIIIIHRRLNIPYGLLSKNMEPKILCGTEWKSFNRVHSIKDLLNYYQKLTIEHKEKISLIAKTEWSDIPVKLFKWISIIDEADRSSTYFRYPTLQNLKHDERKASFKKIDPDQLITLSGTGKKIKAFCEVNENDEIINAYIFDPKSEKLKKITVALIKASDLLSGAHLGLRVELANGQ